MDGNLKFYISYFVIIVASVYGCTLGAQGSKNGTPVFQKPNNVFSASDFGCVVNDGIDDTACLQATIDAMVAADVGGSIFHLEAGSYEVISNNLYIDWNKSYTMQGAGASGLGTSRGTQLIWKGRADAVKSVTVLEGGRGCTDDPVVTFSGGGGSGASAIALRQGPTGPGTVDFIHVPIESQGFGYKSKPKVTVTGSGCEGVKAIAVMHSRKPVLRLIGPLFATFKDFTIQATSRVAAGIVTETKKGVTTRTNIYQDIYCQGIDDNIEKCFVHVDGNQSAINFPHQAGPKGSGGDGNNDAHRYINTECANYTFACWSAEASQAKAIEIRGGQCDASTKAMNATVDAMVAAGDTTSSSALDVSRGPYCATSLHAMGGGQKGVGGSFNIYNVLGHRNVYDFALAPNDATTIMGTNIEASRRFILACGKGPNAAPFPLNIIGNRWATTIASTRYNGPAVDSSGILTLGCGGPYVITGNIFQGPMGSKKVFSPLRGKIYSDETPVIFQGNTVRWWESGVEGSLDHAFWNNARGLNEDSNYFSDSSGKLVSKTKNKTNAKVAPTENDDFNDGYGPGSIWIDTVANKIYLMKSNRIGSAIWLLLK